MAELTTAERLQPSLLDRLTDNDPTNSKETRDQRVMSLHQLREAVRRDLASLLNAGCLATTEDMESYPYIAHSVVNFGIPDLAGMTIHGADTLALERALHQAITDFEPRILASSLRVRVLTDVDEMYRNALVFTIEGKLWAHPMPLQLLWNTEVDLETGDVNVKEGGA